MLQKIEEKIQEIRRQPESVRMRYLFLCVGTCMAFILLIWVFSLYETKEDFTKSKPDLPVIEELGTQGKSLETLLENDIPLQADPQKSGGDRGQTEGYVLPE